MAENFDVKLVEEMKYYSPGPEYKRNSWIGDYQKVYDEFQEFRLNSGPGE